MIKLFKNTSLSFKIISILLLLTIQLFTTHFFEINQLTNTNVQERLQNMKSIQNSNGLFFEAYLNTYGKLQELLSTNESVINYSLNQSSTDIEVKTLLKKQITIYQDQLYIYIGTSDKRMLLTPEDDLPEGYDPTTRPWYTLQVSYPQKFVITEPYQDVSTGQLIITIQKQITYNDKIVGVVGIDFTISQLVDKLFSENNKLGYLSQVVNNTGTIVLHTINKYVGKSVQNTEFFNKWKSGPDNDVFGYIFDNIPRFTQYKRLSNGWIYQVIILKEQLVKEQTHIKIISTIIFQSVQQITILFQLIILRMFVSKPLKKIISSIFTIQSGNFTERINYDSKNEIGQVSKELDKMTESLSHLIKDIQIISNQTNEENSQLSDISNDLQNVSDQLTQTLKQFEKNLSNISQTFEELSSGIEEISQSSVNIQESQNKLQEKSENVSKLSEEGKLMLEHVVKLIQDINIKINSSFESIQKLVSNSRNIEEILNTIKTIQDQTNLLQLNQQIEQARQGEHGRGFQVVADEVRKLSEQSKQSVHNINEILKKISDDSKIVENKTKETLESIVVTSNTVQEVKSFFDTILDNILSLTQMIETIAQNTEEQSQSIQEMTSQINTSNKSLSDLLSQINNIVSINDDTIKQIDKLIQSKTQLESSVLKLKNSISKFKI